MSYALGQSAYKATFTSLHYAFLRDVPAEEAEKLFFASDNPSTPIQFVMPLAPEREKFRRGWNDARLEHEAN